jgi:hypothetical protein
MIEVTTIDGKNIKMTFKKFDDTHLHGEEYFVLKMIPLENIATVKVVTTTYKMDEQEAKDAAKGVGAGVLHALGCVLGYLLGASGDCR